MGLFGWSGGSMPGVNCFASFLNGCDSGVRRPKHRNIVCQSFEERFQREREDQESGTPKCRAAEADTEMQDLLERAEKALMRVQFPEVCQTADGEYRPDLDDIVERVARVSANYMPRKDAEGLKNAFDALPYDYGTRLRCLLRMVGPYLPDGDTLTEAGADARDSGDIASCGQAEQRT